MESVGVLEGAHQLRRQVGVVGIVKNQTQVVGFDLAQLRPRGGCYKNEQADAINQQRGNAVETAVRLNLTSAITSPMPANF